MAINPKCDVLRSYWSLFLQYQWTVRLVTTHPLVRSLTHTFCCRSGLKDSLPARVSNLASESDDGLELLVASARARAKQSTPNQARTVRPKKTAKEKGPAPAPSDDEDDDCLPPCFGVPAPPYQMLQLTWLYCSVRAGTPAAVRAVGLNPAPIRYLPSRCQEIVTGRLENKVMEAWEPLELRGTDERKLRNHGNQLNSTRMT